MTKKKVGKKISGEKSRGTFKTIWLEYLGGKTKLEKYQWAGILMLVWVVAGFVGWVYEALVGLIENGEFYMVGGDLLPWINIYAIGAVLLVPVAWRFRQKPWAVFLMAVLITGAVELIGGWLVYTIGNGTRYWNYDHGLWLFGSINGFVCVLSVTIFGIFALILAYVILPLLVYLASKMSRRAFLTLAAVLFAIVMVDEVANLCLKNAGQPTAMDFYRSIGCKYQEF